MAESGAGVIIKWLDAARSTTGGTPLALVLEAARDMIVNSVSTIERQAAEITELRAEVERLRAGGCARDQSTTQYCAEAAALAAEAERLRALTTWRPIDDEAKRAPEILAYSEQGGTGTMLVRWIAPVDFLTDSEIEQAAGEGADDAMLETPDWFYADFLQGGRLYSDCYPTHYMPLPPPADSMSGEG